MPSGTAFSLVSSPEAAHAGTPPKLRFYISDWNDGEEEEGVPAKSAMREGPPKAWLEFLNAERGRA